MKPNLGASHDVFGGIEVAGCDCNKYEKQELFLGQCLRKTKLIFTNFAGSFAGIFARTPPYRKQNKCLIFGIHTVIPEINVVECCR
jgi:hypothetical protein